MNSPIAAIAFICLLWLTTFFFNTLADSFLGVIGIMLAILQFGIIIWAVWEDWRNMTGRNEVEDDD